MYYCKNLVRVTEIVRNFEGDGLTVRKAKAAVNEPSLCAGLVTIKSSYSQLIPLIEKMESATYTIEEAHQLV